MVKPTCSTAAFPVGILAGFVSGVGHASQQQVVGGEAGCHNVMLGFGYMGLPRNRKKKRHIVCIAAVTNFLGVLICEHTYAAIDATLLTPQNR